MADKYISAWLACLSYKLPSICGYFLVMFYVLFNVASPRTAYDVIAENNAWIGLGI